MARPYTDEERKKLKKKFLKVYKENYALIYDACDRIGISKETLYNWMEADSDFADKVHRIKDRVGDIVEGKLMEKILEGNVSSIVFWLKTQRGWSETQKIEVDANNDIDINAAIKEIREQLKDDNE